MADASNFTLASLMVVTRNGKRTQKIAALNDVSKQVKDTIEITKNILDIRNG